jgi:iron complex outermembrane receptor protein
VDITSAAAFAQFEWRFQPRWTLIVGGRYSYEEKETELVNSTRPEVAATLTAPLPYTDKDDWNEFTPRVTLQYQLDNVMLYGTYARGFKSGGFNYPLLTAGVPQPVLEPEILDMYEVGAKGQLYDNKIRYDASLYFYDYSDLQVTRSVGGTTVVTENAANAKVFGLDLNVDWAPMENWLISFNMSLLDTEYEDYIASTRVYGPTTGTVPVPFDADGHEMIRAPDWSANISSSYEFRIGERRLPVVVSYSYKDDYYFDFVAAPTMSVLKQDGYGILNARMTYFSASEVWSISIWGKNLTDKEYLNEAATIASGIRGSWGDPRTYGVDVQFNFGGS